VWAVVAQLVPASAPALLSSKPGVQISDLGESCRVSVRGPRAVVARDYVDPARSCERRARFAAELIIVTLMPPQLALDEVASDAGSASDATPPTPTSTAAALPPVPLAMASAPEPTKPKSLQPRVKVRFEVSGVANEAPPLFGAPGLTEWGADLRARLLFGPVSGMVGVAYWPQQPFTVGAFQGALARVPGVLGVGVRPLTSPIDLQADLAFALSYEQFCGLSPHTPGSASRITPGIELAVMATTATWAGLSPLLGARVAWMPVTQNLYALPQVVGTTPSWWLTGAVGVSWAP
jgi:hypothetical protein